MKKAYFLIGVFLVTSSNLMLQIIQTRLISTILWYHLAFFIISLAMFGLTAGAVWVYLRGDRFSEKTLSYDMSYFSGLYAIATALALIIETTLIILPSIESWGSVMSWLLLAIYLSMPFFFSGVVISLALTRSPYPIGQVYGVDLIGAAVGCLGVLLLLNNTDAPSAVFWIAAMAAASVFFFARSDVGEKPKHKPFFAFVADRPMILVVLLVSLAVLNGLTSRGIYPLMIKGKLENRNLILYEEWNSFSRITSHYRRYGQAFLWGPSPRVRSLRAPVNQRLMRIDGAAGTPMYEFKGDIGTVNILQYDLTNLAYFLPGLERAGIIGVGGGRDVLSARVFRIGDITGVEINPIFIKLLKSEPGFADYAGLNNLKGVNLVVDEARSWYARTDQTFDIIQMSMIDTWAATGAGAFTLSENGLYTVESWKIFMNRLSPNGVFTVSRWYAPGEVNETGRIISLAAATLMEMGVTEPRRHIFLASIGKIATLILSRTPFLENQIAALERTAAGLGYKILISPNTAPNSQVLNNILNKKSMDELWQYTHDLALDLTPATDEKPFFFNQLRLNKPLKIIEYIKQKNLPRGVISGNLQATLTLFLLLILSTVLVLATIVVPLSATIKDVQRKLVIGGTAYFFFIGMGFMLIEIALLQRMSVFLGHPIYSLSIVLFSLILTTGFGSLIFDRIKLDGKARFAVWAVFTSLYILSLPFLMPAAFQNLESSGLLVRAAVCVIVIAPAGILMGFGFPSGMRFISAIDQKPTPWFWGINGAAGVLSAAMAVAISLTFGISMNIYIAGACYLMLIPAAFTIGIRERILES